MEQFASLGPFGMHAALTRLNLTLLNLQQNCKNVTNLLIQCLVKYY